MSEYTKDQPLEALAFTAATPDEGLRTVRLTPAGEVQSMNGTFVMDEEAARLIIEAFDAHGTALPIDYEHQTLGGEYASPDGKAPAAGWIEKVFYEQGRGLQALVRWNERGAKPCEPESTVSYRRYCRFGRTTGGRSRCIRRRSRTNRPFHGWSGWRLPQG